MHKTLLVAKHEFLVNVKRRAFLFAAFGVPLLLIAIMVVITSVAIDNETNIGNVGTVGYVDQAGVIALVSDSEVDFQPYDSTDAAAAALQAGDISAYFVVAEDYLRTGDVQLISTSGTPEALTDEFDGLLVRNLGSDLDPELLERFNDPVNMVVNTLDNGRIIRDEAVVGLFIAPIIFVVVFMMASQVTSGYLMSGVVEEKTNRIMEILVTSITPFELLFGKIIGLAVLGLTQLAIWIGAGFIFLTLGQASSVLAGVSIPPDLLIIGLIYFLLGYFLFASIMAGVGAVVGSEQESRQIAGIFSFALAIPFILIVNFLTDPNGTIVTILTLFPLTSPISVILRMGFGTVPTWQLILSIVLLLLTTLFTVWASARVFRWALLLYGKPPSLREVLRVIRRSEAMATTATEERAA